jgi:hypothetical protein
MELEVAGRPSFVDSACGMVIPAGADHGYLAAPQTQVLVIDAPMAQGLDKLRRFAVPPALRFPQSSLSAAAQMALVLQAPTLLQRRGWICCGCSSRFRPLCMKAGPRPGWRA